MPHPLRFYTRIMWHWRDQRIAHFSIRNTRRILVYDFKVNKGFYYTVVILNRTPISFVGTGPTVSVGVCVTRNVGTTVTGVGVTSTTIGWTEVQPVMRIKDTINVIYKVFGNILC